jgi:hypothetical protein
MNAEPRRIEGRHVLAGLVAFFGVIIGVNLTLAVLANTSWTGRLTKTKPNVRFKAKGEANFLGPQPIVQRITVKYGEPVIPRTPEDPTEPVETFIPGPPQEVSIDRGGNDPFPEPANRVKIRVFGSRLSYNVFTPTGGTNGTVEGTGGGGFAF